MLTIRSLPEVCINTCAKVASVDPAGVIAGDVPYYGSFFDPDTLRIMSEISARPSFELLHGFTKGVPSQMALKKIFGVTTIEIG